MYEGLSLFYDEFTDDIDYPALAAFIRRRVRASGAFKECRKRGEKPVVLDAGCGTGTLTGLLAEGGWDMIGLDASAEMLDAAREKFPEGPFLWICQDMSRMDLFGTVTAAVSMTDSVDHITSQKQLEQFFLRTRNFLEPGGLFIFDVLTEAHFTGENSGKMQYFADYETASCFWRGRYSPRTRLCTYDISCFMLTADGTYERTDDTVRERIWAPELLETLLKAAGFGNISRLQPGRGAPGGKTGRDRLYFVAEKPWSVGQNRPDAPGFR